MRTNLVRYCPGSAVGSPALMTPQQADEHCVSVSDTRYLQTLRGVKAVAEPVHWPHVGGYCSVCEPKAAAATEPAWSARCDCYNGHPSSSGRCTCRNDGGTGRGVTDPTRHKGEIAVCQHCRENCPAGKGSRIN